MSRKRKLTSLILRASPFHNGHAELIKRALELSEKVLVIVGSANQPRTPKNPWTAHERGLMIYQWYKTLEPGFGLGHGDLYNDGPQRLVIEHNRDWMYNNTMWLQATVAIIKKHEPVPGNVWITGADRDSSTFYLKELLTFGYNPDLVTQSDAKVSQFLNATAIREMYFGQTWAGAPLNEGQLDVLMKSLLPPTTLQFLRTFRGTPEYARLINEYQVAKKRVADNQPDEERRSGDPRDLDGRRLRKSTKRYETINQAADAVVIQTGHVLLVRRRAAPGAGLWAFPGGHLDPREWMLDCAIRELYEETRLDVPEKVLRGSLLFDDIFEHPDRSQIGRLITRAFCFKLNDYVVDDKIVLPKTKPQEEEVEKVKWFPLSEALSMSDQLFDDHHPILERFVARLPVDKR